MSTLHILNDWLWSIEKAKEGIIVAVGTDTSFGSGGFTLSLYWKDGGVKKQYGMRFTKEDVNSMDDALLKNVLDGLTEYVLSVE